MPKNQESDDNKIRLNKFIANSGTCSRREADNYIKSGFVTVNGELVRELGHKVLPTDKVHFGGELIKSEKKEYVLLNKPKNFITTVRDEKGRRTVMELITNATSNRLYPVGRLDRNTLGVLLFTNDGDLALKLMHPKYRVKKIYQVSLNKSLKQSDFEKIKKGVTLEDGSIYVDDLSYLEGKPKNEVGITIHSGKNRIVRRIFEHLGYEVIKLDRVYFAGLTKKGLKRGDWRALSAHEVVALKMLNVKSKKY